MTHYTTERKKRLRARFFTTPVIPVKRKYKLNFQINSIAYCSDWLAIENLTIRSVNKDEKKMVVVIHRQWEVCAAIPWGSGLAADSKGSRMPVLEHSKSNYRYVPKTKVHTSK